LKDKSNDTNQLSAHFFRHNYAKMVAVLIRHFGLENVETAEDIVQDTLLDALEQWSIRSIPSNPEAWLMDVAKKKTINYLKRNGLLKNKVLPALQKEYNSFVLADEQNQKDNTLRLIFTCCHPALPKSAQIAMALKSLCGLSIPEIANALLTNDATINKRLYRAKQKFREGRVAYEIPDQHELPKRIDNVYAVLYLLFNEGYHSKNHKEIIRMDLCFEAIRLLKQLLTSFPNQQKGIALLSLMLLSVARFRSRLDDKGALVILSKQDRKRWDKELIAEGIHYLHLSAKGKEVNTYQLQAGIAAEHCIAESFASTNWGSIYRQYSILEKLDNNSLIKFNRCIAQFYKGEKNTAMDNLLQLRNEKALKNNVHFHATVGVFYQALNFNEEAMPFFKKSLALSKSEKEKSLIRQRMED